MNDYSVEYVLTMVLVITPVNIEPYSEPHENEGL